MISPQEDAAPTAGRTAMTTIKMRAKVGPDGVLTLSVPVGMDVANRDLRVIVEPIDATAPRRRPR
jgi:hypothetical protein